MELDPPQGRHELDGSVVLTGDDPWLDLTVVTKGVRLEPFSDAFALPLPVTGNLTNTVHVTGTLKILILRVMCGPTMARSISSLSMSYLVTTPSMTALLR